MKTSRLVQMNPKDMKVDHTYQQPLRERQVAKIAAAWADEKADVVNASLRDDGKTYVFDGQHRVVAARRAGIPQIWVKLWTGMTYEEEAEAFVSLNADRIRPTTASIFRGRLAHRDPLALAVADACQETGVALRLTGSGNDSPGTTRAFSALDRIAEYDRGLLVRTLRICREAWPTDPKAISAVTLYGIASFLWAYGSHPTVSEKELVRKLARVPVLHLVQRCAAISSAGTAGTGGGGATPFNKAGPREAVRELWNFRRQIVLSPLTQSELRLITGRAKTVVDAA